MRHYNIFAISTIPTRSTRDNNRPRCSCAHDRAPGRGKVYAIVTMNPSGTSATDNRTKEISYKLWASATNDTCTWAYGGRGFGHLTIRHDYHRSNFERLVQRDIVEVYYIVWIINVFF